MWDNVVDGVMNDNDWMREAKEDADGIVDSRDSMKHLHSLAQKTHKKEDDSKDEDGDTPSE